MNEMNPQRGEKRNRPPFYYFALGALVFAMITTAVKEFTSFSMGPILYGALSMFFIFFLPKSLWEAKVERNNRNRKD